MKGLAYTARLSVRYTEPFMYLYVLSVSRTRLRLGLAQLSPQGAAEDADLEGLSLTLTRADLEWPEELPRPPKLPEALHLLRVQTRDWPTPLAVATLVEWDKSMSWAGATEREKSQAVLIAPEHLAEASAQLAGETVQGGFSLQLALAVAEEKGVPALAVPLPRRAELPPEARETGIPSLKRDPKFHVLNSEMVAREAAYNVGKKFAEAAVVVAHLGGTSSVTAYQGGRVVSSTGSGISGGPMGLRGAGPVSPEGIAALQQAATQNKEVGCSPEAWLAHWHKSGGLRALTGYSTVRDLAAAEAGGGDSRVQAAQAAFVYQVACAVAGQCGALSTRPDALALTGPLAGWNSAADALERRLAWIAPVFIIPGDLEFEAVARAAGRVLLEWATPNRWEPPQMSQALQP